MDKKNRRPILYNGQIYSEPITKSSGFNEKSMPFTYDEARDFVLRDIAKTKRIINNMPKASRLPNEVVLSLKLQPEFAAKSYYPEHLFDLDTEKFGIKEIGSRVLRDINNDLDENGEEVSSTTFSKMFFIRATENSLERLENQLNKSTNAITKGFQTDIRKISSLGILSENEQIQGITEEWTKGRLEAVLHPFDVDRNLTIEHFMKLISDSGVDLDNVKYKQYESGVTFISFTGDRNVLDSISGYNPLRTVHPLQLRDLPTVNRGFSMSGGFIAPAFTKKSTTVVGVIDGGLDTTNPYVQNYIDYEFSVSGTPIDLLIEHGTQVTGTVLYGPLNKYSPGSILPEPLVSVKNFGVLSSTTDLPDLYDAIDAIEKIVPANNNIDVYNLSVGPKGPIFDDSISRFTYSCDKLSYDYNKLFCVAVGNDGHIPGYDRIQSPSDAVNCLAIGAYTTENGSTIRAPYSSIGPGREGCKMKPDISAFGGCSNHPIHLISSNVNEKILSAGTSFASPIVSSVAARLIGESENTIDPLIAKALLVHSSLSNEGGGHSKEMGHGILSNEINDIVTCGDKSYTLIYRGEIEQGKYAEFLIPWDDLIQQGKAHFKWTVAVLTEVDQLSSDDYTSSSVEVTFYPNRNKYMFSNTNGTPIDGGVVKKTEVVDIVLDSERAQYLVNNGWTQGNFPKTDSPKTSYKTEAELRDDLKWDSLDTREFKKMAKGINEPSFHIHALGRGNRSSKKKVKFALIFTVTTPKAEVDIYANILNKYSALIPIQMRIETEVNIQTNTGE